MAVTGISKSGQWHVDSPLRTATDVSDSLPDNVMDTRSLNRIKLGRARGGS